MSESFDKELKQEIGIAMFGPKYYDYILTPPTDPPSKYPYPKAIEALDQVVEAIKQSVNTHIIGNSVGKPMTPAGVNYETLRSAQRQALGLREEKER